MNSIAFEKLQLNTEQKLGKDFAEPWFFACLSLNLLLSWNLNITLSQVAYLALFGGRVLLCLLFLVKAIFLSRCTWKEELIQLGILLVFGISSLITRQVIFFCTLCAMFAARGIYFRRIAKCICFTMSGMLVITLALVAFGVVDDFTILRYGTDGELLRRSLGFNYPNLTGLWVMMIVFSGIVACWERMKLRHFAYCLLPVFGCWFVAYCRTAFVLSILGIVALALAKNAKRVWLDKKWVRMLAYAVTPLLVVVFWLLLISYSSQGQGLARLGDLLGQHISFTKEGLEYWGLSWFGQSYEFSYIIDSLYVYLPIRYGIIPSLLFLGITEYGIYQSVRHRRIELTILWMIFAIYNAMEQAMIHSYNLALLSCFALLVEDCKSSPDHI